MIIISEQSTGELQWTFISFSIWYDRYIDYVGKPSHCLKRGRPNLLFYYHSFENFRSSFTGVESQNWFIHYTFNPAPNYVLKMHLFGSRLVVLISVLPIQKNVSSQRGSLAYCTQYSVIRSQLSWRWQMKMSRNGGPECWWGTWAKRIDRILNWDMDWNNLKYIARWWIRTSSLCQSSTKSIYHKTKNLDHLWFFFHFRPRWPVKRLNLEKIDPSNPII